MINIFDIVKVYSTSEWEEVESRKFNNAELNVMGKCKVVKGTYNLAVRIELAGDKCTFIPLDKRENVEVNEELDKNTLVMAHLKYTGTNPSIKVKDCLVIRIEKEQKAPSFDNPFGL